MLYRAFLDKACREGRRLKSRPSRGPYMQRPERTRDELLQYLRDEDIRSRRELEAVRAANDPTPYDYVKEFESWANALEEAHGKKRPEIFATPESPEYLIRTVIELELWTQNEYRILRRQRPDIVPSNAAVIRVFGCFSNLFEAARAKSLKETMYSYALLWSRLGKTPTVEDCRRHGIDLTIACRVHGGKRAFDRFLGL